MCLPFDRALGVSNPSLLNSFRDLDVILARSCHHFMIKTKSPKENQMYLPFDRALGVSNPSLLHAFWDHGVLLARNCQHIMLTNCKFI